MTYGQPPFPGQPDPGGYGMYPNAGAQDPRDLTLPLYGATFGQAVSRFFRNYVNFSGRASQSEYWWAILMTFFIELAALMVAGVIAVAVGGDEAAGVIGLFIILVLLAIMLPTISVSVRRLHDANMSGWLYLLNLIPLVNYVVWIVIGVVSTNPAGARYDRR